MKKFIVIIIGFLDCFFASGKDLFEMKVANQAVADAIDSVCLIYKDKKTNKPIYGGHGRTIIRRKLQVGETVFVNSLGSPECLSDSTKIYSPRFSSDLNWSEQKISDWQKYAKKNKSRLNFFASNAVGPRNCDLTGFILSGDTLAPIKAAISFFDSAGIFLSRNFSDSLSGFYSIKLPPGQYRYEVKAEGFLLSFGSFDLIPARMSELEIRLPRVTIDNRIILRNIFFEFAKAALKKESFAGLDALADFLKEYPSMQIEISGHTDNKGTEAYNDRLSRDRAEAVVNYLVQKGIGKKQLNCRGAGFSEPIAPNFFLDGSDNPAGRQENRRTEFKILRL
ncbi:MAG: Outer membrane protein 3a [Candidatus Nomurabacteria bacterium GW2011_GWB1_37_5]|uniref:Outer membrane protein 3a n=1 Tax=Candidatus Nomurabacteria bacterium GW2011_GWB1_37_5 TaxID=1618742 RepID=A0A0G0GX97_9BACT|nr:MAG: Outer membrane protein 3a [Candidatus Nomurabacteria bacterium GW2011_GWB1_37_5]